ncbi:hypothetical protein [Kluyvera georgiana]|uniref:hypothetical protein n=1 Tax=Kluyvera georgiana TaxID=73098 RepID=UPI003AEFD0F7
MKSFLTKSLMNIGSYALLSLLAYSAIIDNQQLIGISVAAYWVVIFLGLFMGALIMVLSVAKDHTRDETAKQKLIELVREATKRRSKVMRGVQWVCLVSITMLLAYSGWVFTAVIYVLVGLIVKFFLSIARDNVAEQKEGAV